MSLQNNINKFPKHLQHVRLQKEEEEEQWISGEELCTEGSSDEENTNDVKKKLKSKPIHLPSKDSFKIKLSASTSSTTSLSSVSTKESDEDNTDSTESSQKTPTQWRPKRGSIKLPNIVEKPLDMETKIWSSDFEYQQAVKQIKNEINAATENLNNNEYREEDNKLYDTIDSALENELEILTKTLEECTQDRINYQNYIFNELKHYSRTSLEQQNTKKFLDIIKNKSDSPRNKNNLKHKIKHKKKRFSKKKCKYPVHKPRKMTDVVLNDDEKARLIYLLSNIDIEEIDYNDSKEKDDNNTKEVKFEDLDLNTENAFEATNDELLTLQNIEQKIKTLQEMCDDADLKGKLSEDIYSVDEETREWKAFLKLTEDKYRRINDKINKLHEDDPIEKKET